MGLEAAPASSLAAVPGKAWLMLTAGPALFLLGIVMISIVLGARGVPAAQIPGRVTAFAPHILLGVLLLLAALLALLFAAEARVAWVLPPLARSLTDVSIGVIAGALLAVAYFWWLAPMLEALQRSVGDYVPPGSVLPAVSGKLGLFLVANLVLAPWVEETLYRGIALPLLAAHVGVFWAVVLTCLFFGLLHWAGGFWYMLLTGVVAGGLFAGLLLWRRNILAPFAAHLMLNLIEFIHASRAQSNA